MIKNILNLGDAALYCDFGKDVNRETNTQVIRYFKSIQKENIASINNLSPSYNKLIISFDLKKTNFIELKKKIEDIKTSNIDEQKNKKIEIPICCDEEFFLDKERLIKKLKLSAEEILEKYLNKSYFCYMTGFVAGMPFLGDISKELRTDRLKTPRVKVPEGSVGITEQFSNIYTFESPGGWNIIGKTPYKIFNSNNKANPVLINPGDNVHFFPISKDEFLKLDEK